MSIKQVILVNEALNLPRGKLAAQVAHAAVASLLSSSVEAQKEWLTAGMPNIVLAANSEAELLGYYHEAKIKNIPARLIKDAGKTVVEAGTITWMGIGPASEAHINEITGALKLLR